ncbi:uncharacterized protein LOC118268702 isoform X2 [Spodoptera frugiperda]|uniref:Uncharacterized protein LOC118268702 isoform X2 n=1 Tax=Spodoptera frugiperda TaxID=7108 RepID=A0A9R0DU23_SPOFR|nr:uncharacterized protein LOC118268702 isoform X2 [Spodoptera frugiperda]
MSVAGGNATAEEKKPGYCEDSTDSDNDTERKRLLRRISTSKCVGRLPVVKEGYLMKQTRSFQRWQRRYFRLRGRTLYYAKEKDYWVDYKSKLKRRASTVRLSQTQTGGGPPSVPPLSDIEKKFISIMGEGYGSGLPNVQVDPFAPQAITSSAAATEGAMVVWPADSPNLIESISRQEEVPSPAAVPPVIPQQEGLPTQPPLVQPLQGEIPLPRLVPRVRSRRRRGMSKEEARRQLVQLSQERLAVDQERLAVDQERLAVDQERLAVERENAESLKQILIGINKIADKMDRTGGRETSDEGASSS